jgi:hypothetical protein
MLGHVLWYVATASHCNDYNLCGDTSLSKTCSGIMYWGLALSALSWDVSKRVQQDGILEVGISQVRLMCTLSYTACVCMAAVHTSMYLAAVRQQSDSAVI